MEGVGGPVATSPFSPDRRLAMLFNPFPLKHLRLANRLVHVPVVTRLESEEGTVTPVLKERVLRITRGGIGYFILGAAGVIDRKSGPLLRICDDRFIPGLAELVRTVHGETDAKIGLQIVHFLKLAKSGYRQKVEDLTLQEVKSVVESMVRAAVRVRKAGFDAVEWDAESGMTLSSFLSLLNKRKDSYGGSLENRLRIVLEILTETRKEVGNDFVIGARINGDDFVIGGSTLKHSTVIAKRLAESGVDYISVSCGGKFEDAIPQPGKPLDCYSGYSGKRCWPRWYMPDATNVYLAEAIKKEINQAGFGTPVITSGKIPYPALAEEILQQGKADLIGLARALICDPEWPKKAKEGREEEIVRCIYCDHCSNCDRNFQPVVCVQWPKGSFNAPLEWEPDKSRFSNPIEKEDE
jgi:2,4-dienoyl-CoA reductase-like NADH-dependent reductase (Old Yellow Enzyme family)